MTPEQRKTIAIALRQLADSIDSLTDTQVATEMSIEEWTDDELQLWATEKWGKPQGAAYIGKAYGSLRGYGWFDDHYEPLLNRWHDCTNHKWHVMPHDKLRSATEAAHILGAVKPKPDPVWMPEVGSTWSVADRQLALDLTAKCGEPFHTEACLLDWPKARLCATLGWCGIIRWRTQASDRTLWYDANAARKSVTTLLDTPTEELSDIEPKPVVQSDTTSSLDSDPTWMPTVGPYWSEADRALALWMAQKRGYPMVLCGGTCLRWSDTWGGPVTAHTFSKLQRWQMGQCGDYVTHDVVANIFGVQNINANEFTCEPSATKAPAKQEVSFSIPSWMPLISSTWCTSDF
jgi:hypothetical protein